MAKFTRRMQADSLRVRQIGILSRTTDRRVFQLAQEIVSLASAAAWNLSNASSNDTGGSGRAWSLRTKAANAMKQAQALVDQQALIDPALAQWPNPSLAEILFLVHVERTDGQLRYPHGFEEIIDSCARKQFIERTPEMFRRQWCKLTGGGREIVFERRSTTQGLSIEAFEFAPGEVPPAISVPVTAGMAESSPGVRETDGVRAEANADGSWRFEIRAKQIGNLHGCAEYRRDGEWWPLGTYSTFGEGCEVAELMREGSHFLDTRVNRLREWGEDAYAEIRKADEDAEAQAAAQPAAGFR